MSGNQNLEICDRFDGNDGLACPACRKGTLVTRLVIDGYGNIVMDALSDPVIEQEPKAVDSS